MATDTLERRTLALLERIHTVYVCVGCGNRGHEGKREPNCVFYGILNQWRAKYPGERPWKP